MSSDRLVIIARNIETDELKLAVDITLYDKHGAEAVLETARKSFSEDWWLSIYRPEGAFLSGTKRRKT